MASYTDDSLRRALKTWRSLKAGREGKQLYHIFSNKALDDMVAKRPASDMMLLGCNGIGQVKTTQYGRELLRIIAEHTPGANPAKLPPAERLPAKHAKSNQPWSYSDCLEFARLTAEGKSNKQIAVKLGRSELAIQMKRTA